MALIVYLIAFSAMIMVLGIKTFLAFPVWLICVIVGIPCAIYLSILLLQYLLEGGLEKDFISKSEKE